MQKMFRVRRAMSLVNSIVIVEDGQGNDIGEAQLLWHLLRRNVDVCFSVRAKV